MGKNAIIQWNCRGLRVNFNEVKLFIQKKDPLAICLQETYLKEDDIDITFKNYTGYHFYALTDNNKATGGTCIYIRNDIPHCEVPLDTELQAKAIQINDHKQYTLCSIYIPPSKRLELRDLDNIYDQLPSPPQVFCLVTSMLIIITGVEEI